MNINKLIGIFLLLLITFLVKAQNYSVQPVSFNQVTIKDNFWSPRLNAHAQSTLTACISQTQDSTARIMNFEKAAGLKEGKHEGIYFDDSDVYKAMEGIAYSLINNPNRKNEALLDKWIDLIAKSQQPDGYLNTFYTLNHLDERWTNMEKHEMYCGGHMIEAAIAHYQATGKRTFFDVAIKFADHLDSTFGPSKRHWVAGHEEIELALVKLYHATQKEKYLILAHWLLEERGHGYGKGSIWENEHWGGAYCQDDVPVSEITDIKGHAVRAMYLFTGMADVAAAISLPTYVEALERVWDDVVYRNMYLTGGIGSSRSNEGFTKDYDLPNKTAYCETCASIGMVFWNNRMNLLTKDAKYADILERSLYNGVLSGVSLEGDLFFYVNPLESDGDHHRKRWFGCACCPSNISRFIPSVGNYIYVANEKEIFVNLYIGNKANIEMGDQKVQLVQKTNYPWDGNIQLEVKPSIAMVFTLKMRIPEWCKNYKIEINGKKIDNPVCKNGYVGFDKKWNTGDKIDLYLNMPVEVVSSDPRVKENVGKRAIQRGPLVYCLEQIDNKNINLDDVALTPANNFKPAKARGKLKGMTLLKTKSQNLTFIPYFAWDNREPGKMKVWIDYKK